MGAGIFFTGRVLGLNVHFFRSLRAFSLALSLLSFCFASSHIFCFSYVSILPSAAPRGPSSRRTQTLG